MNPIRVKRSLIPAGEDYRLSAEFYIAKVIHPDDLERQIDCESLPRAFLLSTFTENGDRFKTASFDLREGLRKIWQVSSYHRFVNNLDAAGELKFKISSEGKHIFEDTYYRGEALDSNSPWVFEMTGSSLHYIGQGSVKSNKDMLAIVSRSKPLPANSIANVIDDGALIETDLRVFKIYGKVEVIGLSGNFVIQCNSGESKEYKVSVESSECAHLKAALPIFLGPPLISFSSEGVSQFITEDELYWYTKDRSSLIDLNDPSALGSGVIVWNRNSELLWEKRCIILPRNFKSRTESFNGTVFNLIISNAQSPRVGLGRGVQNLLKKSIDYDGDELNIEISPNTADIHSIELIFDWFDLASSECKIAFPISYNIALLTDRKGNPYRILERGELTISELSNLQLEVITDFDINEIQLVVSVYGKSSGSGNYFLLIEDSRPLACEQIDGKATIKGNRISDFSTGLFALTDQLDCSMKFQIWAGGIKIPDQLPSIFRYKHDPKFVDSHSAFTLMPTPTLLSSEDPVMYLSPIWDFEREPIELRPEDRDANVWRFNLPALGCVEYGAWLVWTQSRLSVHPRVKLYEVPALNRPSAQLGTFATQLKAALSQGEIEEFIEPLHPLTLAYRVKYLNSDDRNSLRLLNKSVNQIGYNIDDSDWDYIDGLVKRIEDIEPLAMYSMTSLQFNRRTLAALLFRYPERFHDLWDLAQRIGTSWYSIDPNVWISVIRQYFESYQKDGELLREIDEDAFLAFVFRKFEKFAAKGPYFIYLLDIATDRPCFEPVAVWDDDNLRESGLSDQTVSAILHKKTEELKIRHKGILLDRLGTKRFTERFLASIEKIWPADDLPQDLQKLLQQFEVNSDSSLRKKHAYSLTLSIPIKLGFCLSNFYRLPEKKERLWLNMAIVRLDEFDREWLQSALQIAYMACDIVALESRPDPSTLRKM